MNIVDCAHNAKEEIIMKPLDPYGHVVKLCIKMPEEMRDEYKRLCKGYGSNTSNMTRWLIEQFMDRQHGRPSCLKNSED